MITTIDLLKDISALDVWDGRSVYVESIGQTYTYHSNNMETNNGVTVIGNWVMEVPDSYLASWFAVPNSTNSQSAALNLGYAYATGKGRPFVIDGVYWVDALYQASGEPISTNMTAIKCLSNSKINFLYNSSLNVIANSSPNYYVLSIYDVENIEIINAKIVGDRLNHTYTSGSTHEWGYGIAVYECNNVTLTNPNVSQMTGDGIYIGNAWGSNLENYPSPKNVSITNPILAYCRRATMSCTSWDSVYIYKPQFLYAGITDNNIEGTSPYIGLNFEPEGSDRTKSLVNNNMIIEDPYFYGCRNSLTARFFDSFDNGLNINIYFKGLTKILSNSEWETTFDYTDVSNKNYKGLVKFDHLVVDSPSNANFTFKSNGDNQLRLEVDELSLNGKSDIRLSFDSSVKNYGGVRILNINNNPNAWLSCYIEQGSIDASSSVINDYVLRLKDTDKGKQFGLSFDTQDDRNKFPTMNNSTLIDGYTLYAGYSISTLSLKMSNKMIFTQPDTTDYINLNTDGDYRELYLKLDEKTTNIGQGIYLSGLSLYDKDNNKCTHAQCKQRGGWIHFKNQQNSVTEIIGIFGDWQFS